MDRLLSNTKINKSRQDIKGYCYTCDAVCKSSCANVCSYSCDSTCKNKCNSVASAYGCGSDHW